MNFSSSFASRTKKNDLVQKEGKELPGPGSYLTQENWRKEKKFGKKMTTFGTAGMDKGTKGTEGSKGREGEGSKGKEGEGGPGPGAYLFSDEFGKQRKPNFGLSVPFSSSSGRFPTKGAKGNASETPGPGEYYHAQHKDNEKMYSSVKKSYPLRQTNKFSLSSPTRKGTSSLYEEQERGKGNEGGGDGVHAPTLSLALRRMTTNNHNTNNHNANNNNTNNTDNHNASSTTTGNPKAKPETLEGVFPVGERPCLPVKRRDQPIKLIRKIIPKGTEVAERNKGTRESFPTPGPGAYFEQTQWGKGKGGAFSSLSQRNLDLFVADPSLPGPGEYELHSSLKVGKGEGTKRPFMTTEKRFREGKKGGGGVGPGEYEEKGNTFVKKSFNATIRDKPILPFELNENERDDDLEGKRRLRRNPVGTLAHHLAETNRATLVAALDLGF
jgi:hypothetical protein